MATPTAWSRTDVDAAGGKMHLARAGAGRPLLVLHHDIGTRDALPIYDELANHFDVLIPHHPGYGKSERPEWMRSVRDVAVIYRGLLADLGIDEVSLLGLGFGGWIAAEMATMAPKDLHRLVLVGAMGINPGEGYILDQALFNHLEYIGQGFHDPKAFEAAYDGEPTTDQLVEWEICREMNFRIAWKPYMYSQTLPHLLSAVRAPTLLVWGDDDNVVPRSAADRYLAALPDARLEIIPACGHYAEMEKPAELAALVTPFIAGN